MSTKLQMMISGFLLVLAGGGFAADLERVSDFGSNPGNLTMYKYVPSQVPQNAPLVVVLHGCAQDAISYARDTGFNKLAEKYKFYVVYAEQGKRANPLKCFNWFSKDDARRGKGEAASIAQMVKKMKADHSIDDKKVFVTGVSAGGCMTANMMAAYPDVFAGGAVMAGIPHGCAENAIEGMACMYLGENKSPEGWGKDIRNASPSDAQESYPILSVFHGSADDRVPPSYAMEFVEQWTNVHGADTTSEISETFRENLHMVYHDNDGNPIVEVYILNGMGHGISVDPGTAEDQGGQQGKYAFKTGIWSSYYAAKFWGLIKNASP